MASWRVLAGASATAMQEIETVPDTSFETAITIPTVSYVAVEALDGTGQTLASSATVQPQ